MLFSSIILAAGVIATTSATALSAGQVASMNALNEIMERQIICKPVSVPSCALSCGEGFITCVSWPTCYNPSTGDTCCSNRTRCSKGFYCTDSGCCQNGLSLAECGATITLSIILPVSTSSTTTTTSAVVTTTTTSAVVTTTTTSSAAPTTTTSSKSSTTTSAAYSSSTTSAAYSYSSSTTSSSFPPYTTTTTARPSTTHAPSAGSSSSSSRLPQFTGGAQALGVGAAQVAVGGLAMLMML